MRTDFQFTCDPPVARLRIAGELDLSTGEDLTDVLECLEFRGCTFVELDVDAVTFIDAYSLALLHHEQCRLRAADGDLRVVAASSCYTAVSRLAQYASLQRVPEDAARLRVLHTTRHLSAQR